MNLNTSHEWLLGKAEQEGNGVVSVGGLVTRLAGEEGADTEPVSSESARRLAFAKFVELSRRGMRLTVEELASRADVDVSELVGIEESDDTAPEPRTIYKLSQALHVPQNKLMEMSGLSRSRDRRLQSAMVRFAARSEPLNVLTNEEEEALREFVEILAQASDGD